MSIFLKMFSYFRLTNYWKPMESDKINHVQSNFLWEKLEEKQVYIIFA